VGEHEVRSRQARIILPKNKPKKEAWRAAAISFLQKRRSADESAGTVNCRYAALELAPACHPMAEPIANEVIRIHSPGVLQKPHRGSGASGFHHGAFNPSATNLQE
jgi:hypothetical protein